MQKPLIMFLAVFAVAIAALTNPAVGQTPFPDEPGRDTVLLACSQCHSAGKMLSVDLTSEEWDFIVYDMLARGANIHAEDVDTVLEYIRNNFATDADKKE